MAEKTIVIWGAGRIGRGFVGDLFSRAGYHLTFVDANLDLIESLRERGQYSVVCAAGEGQRSDRAVTGFDALSTSQIDDVAEAIATADLVAVAVYPRDFEEVALQLVPGLARRCAMGQRLGGPDDSLDIILCTNLAHAGPIFREHLSTALAPGLQDYGEARIGVVESLVIRMVVEPPAEALARDPLLVWTNGYAELPVDGKAFTGDVPTLPFLRPVADMRAEETRKLYTYNTYHAALAYLGALRGHKTIMDCVRDPVVMADAQGALREARDGVRAAFGFEWRDMDDWVAGVVSQTANPALRDTVARYGADPRRKLQRADRLLGPLLLARTHGLPIDHLERAVAAALLYRDPDDVGAIYVQERIETLGLRRAVRVLCSLPDDEDPLLDSVAIAYGRLGREAEWLATAQHGAALAFDLEKTYHGCGQCAIAALLDTLGMADSCAGNAVFESATGLAGGLGLAGDGACGALVGSALVFGLLFPRHRASFDGDRENKYRTYAMVQRLRDRYLKAYGGIVCRDIHRSVFGRAFDLRDAADREAFEAAGAHADKCTGVVARAVEWALEIIGEERIEDGLKGTPMPLKPSLTGGKT